MLCPLTDPKTGEVILYDIFVAGTWVGSRRTIPQCIQQLRTEGWPSSVLATDYQIEGSKIIFE